MMTCPSCRQDTLDLVESGGFERNGEAEMIRVCSNCDYGCEQYIEDDQCSMCGESIPMENGFPIVEVGEFVTPKGEPAYGHASCGIERGWPIA